jgi:hypothetical protein
VEFARCIDPDVYVLIGEGISAKDNPHILDLRLEQARRFIPWAKVGTNKLIPEEFKGDWPRWLLLNVNNIFPEARIDKVVAGPDYSLTGWEKYGVEVIKVPERFFKDSGTKYRKSKGFSIITNFGCSRECFFCAWKKQNHRLQNRKNEIDWGYLDWCIGNYQGYKISISGGGDPLFNLEKNLPILSRIVRIAERHRKLVDLHTNEDLLDKLEVIRSLRFYQVVISASEISEKRAIEIAKLAKFCQVRVVVVYTGQSTEWLKEWIKFYSFAERLTIRQCHGRYTDFDTIKRKLQSNFPKVHFLPDGNYNLYYMPDNKVYEDYEARKAAKDFEILKDKN